VSVTGSALPHAHGAPVLDAVIRTAPEDFIVEEVDAFEASGAGEHLLLTVRKRGMNTAHAARRIAQWAGVAESAIGYAGLKDRHALTTQRFSVWMPGREAPDAATLDAGSANPDESLEVLHAAWHARKLPRGALVGNRFELVLRDVQGERQAIESRLQAIAARGVPNYFGEQRFGRGGDNVGKALMMFAGRRVKRDERTFLLSAARSELFNRVLAARVRAGHWDRSLPGEVWMLAGTRSVFGPEPLDDGLAQRLQAGDIHPTAPLWGAGESRATDAVRALEHDALADPALQPLRSGLERAGLRQERRATRLLPDALQWEWLEQGVLRLQFQLPAGAYATVVLDELGPVHDAATAQAG
jgi:tRNA pseudouridine13 synthase